MSIIIGIVVSLASMIGGFMAMGGHVNVLIQPYEFLIIMGTAAGIFIIANPVKVLMDTFRGVGQAITDAVPKEQDYLEIFSVLYGLMREIKSKGRNEAERHIEQPDDSDIFRPFPKILADRELVTFICDYMRLITIGNVKPHEIESLMDEDLQSIGREMSKPYQALASMAEALPALGIVAAVLGVVKAMGAIDQSPAILGGLIAAALVGTFLGIFMSYAVVSPIAYKVKYVRDKQYRRFVIVKHALLAFTSGAAPQTALEHGRKIIGPHERPTIDKVEQQTMNGGAQPTTATA